MYRKPFSLLSIFLLLSLLLLAQRGNNHLTGTIVYADGSSAASATATLLRAKDSSVSRIAVSDQNGHFEIENIPEGSYLLSVSHTGYRQQVLPVNAITGNPAITLPIIKLEAVNNTLEAVTVVSKKPLIEFKAGRTIINVDASVTNIGSTALEVLERSPGVTVDRNGTISLKGRQNVLIMLDDKPTYLSQEGLMALLGSLPASQIELLEIMTNPPAKYDASGSTGIINIRTKKNKTRGINGNVSVAYGQGRYYKTANSFNLNYRNGAYNLFVAYTVNSNKAFTDLYALRTYFKPDGTVISFFDQPSYLTGQLTANTLKTGIDYFLSKKTTAGITLTGFTSKRQGTGNSTGYWKNPFMATDSVIQNLSSNNSDWKNGGISVYLRHTFDASKELSIDLDHLAYRAEGDQFFHNKLTGIVTNEQILKGNLPTDLKIFSGKADYTQTINNNIKLQAGWKSSSVSTDNIADYFYQEANAWKQDLNKTNHFIYHENIYAAYTSISRQSDRWEFEGGLRYESTNYDASQKGNAARKDSSFSRQYNSLFPTAFVSYKADSIHTFTFSAGRRIDRPGFQKLNPFVYLINKYTYQRGNPFFRPQYTWNFEVAHSFKDIIVTTLNYGITKDYFSQIFLNDTSGIIVYTEGNLGQMKSFGASISTQLSPAKWWSFSFQAGVNRRIIEGFVYSNLKTDFTQADFNLSNQFRFGKGWSGELMGIWATSQQELQEIIDPAGQIGLGISKQVLKNKGTIKATMRDIFYTQWMKGYTAFTLATEYFKLTRDSRSVSIAFSYRFGKTFKDIKKSNGAADEIKRVSAGS